MKKLTLLASVAALVLTFGAVSYAGSCGSGDHSHTDKISNASAKVEMPDIVQTAIAAGSFNTLVAAVKAAGLVEVLQGDGPFTVFAPTDEAFAALPEGTVESLLKDKEALSAILTYHVVSGKVMAADVVKLNKAKTVNGQSVMIKTSDKGVTIDNANVVKTDIECSNGIIHVIDAVILPEHDK